MHATALTNADLFLKTYVPRPEPGLKMVEIGSQDVNGSLRQFCPPGAEYVGVDFVPGKGVDLVLEDPYKLPLADNSVDIVLSSSVFEHSEMFWLLFTDVLRVLKPHGLFYLNAPSNGDFHQYPVDCWRFYPDSGQALVKWARHSGFNAELLESFVSAQWVDVWNDFVAVFLKDAAHAARYPARMLDKKDDYFNGRLLGKAELLRHRGQTEDVMKRDFLMALCGMKAPRSRHRLAKFLLGLWR
jgi:SAM-dependent methyltransferase